MFEFKHIYSAQNRAEPGPWWSPPPRLSCHPGEASGTRTYPYREERPFLTLTSPDKKQELGPKQVGSRCVSEWLELTLICDMEARRDQGDIVTARGARGGASRPQTDLESASPSELDDGVKGFKAFSATGPLPPRKGQCVHRAETPLGGRGQGGCCMGARTRAMRSCYPGLWRWGLEHIGLPSLVKGLVPHVGQPHLRTQAKVPRVSLRDKCWCYEA